MCSLRSKEGFTLVEIIIVAGIIGILAVVVVRTSKNIIEQVHRNTCITNLIQIDNAKSRYFMEQWVSETKELTFSDLVPDYLRNTPVCPSGGTYTIGNLPTAPSCSISGHEKF